MQTTFDETVLTSRETAEMLKISPRTLHTLTKSGAIASVRIGKRSVRYRLATIQEYLRRQESAVAAA